MIIDHRAAALNCAAKTAAELASLYESEQDTELADPVRALFMELATAREALVGQLSEMVREAGELPRGADPERELLDDVWSRITALFANRPDLQLAVQRARQEQQLVAELTGAIAAVEDEAQRGQLVYVRNQVQLDVDRLHALAREG